MHKLESLPEYEPYKVSEILIYKQIPRLPHLVISNKEKRTYRIVNYAVCLSYREKKNLKNEKNRLVLEHCQ